MEVYGHGHVLQCTRMVFACNAKTIERTSETGNLLYSFEDVNKNHAPNPNTNVIFPTDRKTGLTSNTLSPVLSWKFSIRTEQLRKHLFDVEFYDILWCFGEEGALPEKSALPDGVRVMRGVPAYSDILQESTNDYSKPRLVILDDMQQQSSATSVFDLFTKGSHHRNISVFLIVQNLFAQGKNKRDLSLNTSYIIYFKTPRDRTQIRYLARQVWPQDAKFLIEAFEDASQRAHGYLLFDLKQSTPDNQRFCTNIVPSGDDPNTYCYVPRFDGNI
ncbi:UNVERIFIED_CONTAM: hypothetical protein B566_EDAN019356 [Ephemera danica]|nr:hypothetical protein B566_EDAN019356 [Ephemera danica]